MALFQSEILIGTTAEREDSSQELRSFRAAAATIHGIALDPGEAIRRFRRGWGSNISCTPRPFLRSDVHTFRQNVRREAKNGKRRDAGSDPPAEIAAAINSRAQWLWIDVSIAAVQRPRTRGNPHRTASTGVWTR